MKTRHLAAMALLSSACAVQAENWKGNAELGYVAVTGNSESTLLNAGFKVGKKTEASQHTFAAAVTTAETEGEESAESYSAEWNGKYNLSERVFAFGDLRYLDDRFDSFDEIISVGAGFGYRVLDKDTISWDISLGAGYRDTEFEVSGEDASQATGLGISAFSYQVSESTQFTNDTRVESGDENTFIQNVAALSVAINKTLSLSIKNDVRHNTETAPEDESTDTITSVNVVYNFGKK